MEWEGHQSEDKPGWIHPHVYLLAVALQSHDLEQRRLERSRRRQELWQQTGMAAVSQWLQRRRRVDTQFV